MTKFLFLILIIINLMSSDHSGLNFIEKVHFRKKCKKIKKVAKIF
jgi:hypothetical protein